MTCPAEIMDEASRLGLRISVKGDKLRIEPASRVPAELVQKVRAIKPRLVAALRLEQAAHEACRELGYDISPEQLLAALSPEDAAELGEMAEIAPFLRSFAIALVWSKFRREGIAPPGWNKLAHCEHCGPVLLWASMQVAGCPWCWNRVRGMRIPRPNLPETSR